MRVERGVTFVGVLVVLAICMIGLASAGPLWSQQAKRERERELLRVGALYARALASCREASPGSVKQYPTRLDALLFDSRHIGVLRHLRKLYPDPVNPGQAWGLLRDAEGRIAGVYSRCAEAPIAEGPVDLGDIVLAPAKLYSDWKFMLKVKS